MQLATVDGLTLVARVWPASSPRAAAVVVPGFASGKDNATVVAVAEALCRAGMAVIAHDPRGHGLSEGDCTLGDDERHDVAAAVDAAHELHDRVVVVGASMGAIAALRYSAAATPNGVTGVVAVSSPARWRLPRTPRTATLALLTRTSAGRRWLANHSGIRLSPRWSHPEPPALLADRLSSPLAVIHGTADRYIRLVEAHELHAAAHDPRRLTIVPGMGHAFDGAALPAVVASVDWALSLAPTTTRSPQHPAPYARPSPG